VIVSNNAEPAIEAFLDHHDLRHLVHAVIGRVPGRPELMKPHPDSVLRALDILDRPPAQCVLIGDSVTDIGVSRATGLRSIGYAKTPHPQQRTAPRRCRCHHRLKPRAGRARRPQPGNGLDVPGATLRPMPVKLDNVGIAVRDLDAAIAFFTDLGLTVLGSARISGEWADTAVGLDRRHRRAPNTRRQWSY
jgi:hypothetical protein